MRPAPGSIRLPLLPRCNLSWQTRRCKKLQRRCASVRHLAGFLRCDAAASLRLLSGRTGPERDLACCERRSFSSGPDVWRPPAARDRSLAFQGRARLFPLAGESWPRPRCLQALKFTRKWYSLEFHSLGCFLSVSIRRHTAHQSLAL